LFPHGRQHALWTARLTAIVLDGDVPKARESFRLRAAGLAALLRTATMQHVCGGILLGALVFSLAQVEAAWLRALMGGLGWLAMVGSWKLVSGAPP
jgi:hypothetical protein